MEAPVAIVRFIASPVIFPNPGLGKRESLLAQLLPCRAFWRRAPRAARASSDILCVPWRCSIGYRVRD